MKNLFLILFFSLISTAAFSQEKETSEEEPTSINLNDVIGKNKNGYKG